MFAIVSIGVVLFFVLATIAVVKTNQYCESKYSFQPFSFGAALFVLLPYILVIVAVIFPFFQTLFDVVVNSKPVPQNISWEFYFKNLWYKNINSQIFLGAAALLLVGFFVYLTKKTNIFIALLCWIIFTAFEILIFLILIIAFSYLSKASRKRYG